MSRSSHRQKGTQVNRTTPAVRTPFLRTGIFAALRGVFGGGEGSGAPSSAGGGEGTASLKLAALTAVVAAASLVVLASPAAALTTRQLQTQITGTCPAPGNCSPAERISFAEPEGLTVDSSDRLWVADRFNHAVDRFSAAGAYEAQNTGAGSWEESTEIRSLTFSEAAAEILVADSFEDHLFGLDPATAAFSGKDLALGLGSTIRVAADNSAGATGGDLYVATSGTLLRIKASDGSPDDFTAGPGAGSSELSGLFFESHALAVAPDGDFYWGGETPGGQSLVDQFGPSGELIREITEAGGQPLSFPAALAVVPSSENLLVADNGGHLSEFEPDGTFLGQITKPGGEAFHGLAGLAADSTGHLYVSEASGEPPAIDVFGPVVTLPDVTSGPAEVHSTTEATIHGEVDPAGQPATECFFEYGPTTAYSQIAECEPAAAALGEGTAPVSVHADLTGLTPGTAYHYRLVAGNAEGTNSESEDRDFFTGATIEATSASAVTATSATLETEINPQGLATTYSFQYGPTTAYGSETPMPPAPLGAGTTDVTRSAAIQGLETATTYHFRAVATNSLGTVEGPDRTFTTQGAAAASLLPDSRGWELVSPPLKQGVPLEPIGPEGGGVIQAAADGHAITYFARGSIVSGPAGNRSSINSQDLSTRTASGWSTADITTPHQAPAGVEPGHASEYKLFSTDLSLGAVEPVGATPLSPQAGERTPYLRGPDGSYDPLVTAANVPLGTHFGGVEIRPEVFQEATGVTFITATADLSHLLLESPTSLVEGFVSLNGIYEWSAGAITPVSFVPPGSAALCGGTGPACEASSGPARVGANDFRVRNAISTDGSRVIFNTGGQSGALYLRDLPRGETLLLDAPQGGPGEPGAASFQDASTDGHRVFFTDAERLTPGSTAAPGEPDLYMCEVEVEAGHLACGLRDLSSNAVHTSGPADVQGTVIGAAADGSSVYFVADAALTEGEGAVRGDCAGIEPTPDQSCNLYRSDAATGATRLVAVLSGADFPDWASLTEGINLGELTARVSPNGNWIAFMSERPLTGYDNRDAVSGVRDEEVFLYDAGAGRLLCASCNPTGARPVGRHGADTQNRPPVPLVDKFGIWHGERWFAANVPGWTAVAASHALYQSRYLSDSGRLFFNASDALVPQDTNGTEDVYQYEPPGVGSCTGASPTFASRNGGCVDLISSGTSASESAFMDASESGNDVFFLTASRLTGKDEDTALDLYDARVGGGEGAPVKPVECSGDACQQPAVPAAHPTPGTLLVNGPENVKECPKGKQLKKGKCVKKQQKKAKKHKKKQKHGKKNKHKKGTGKKKRANSDRGGQK